MPTSRRLEISARCLGSTTLLALLLTAGRVHAIDRPISAAKLVLKRTPTRQKLQFTSRDPAFLFPAIGSADDPATGTPGGATIELFSSAEPGGVALAVPAGIGKPGWAVRNAVVDGYQFRNAGAPLGPSPVRKLVFRQGHLLLVAARGTGLALGGPQGVVGVRITAGSLRSCARFDAPTIVHDEAGRFIAHDATAAVLADCSDAALSGTPTSTSTPTTSSTTTTIPAVCGDGIVQSGEECDGASFSACGGEPLVGCFPPGTANECACCSNYDCDARLGSQQCCNPQAACLKLSIVYSGQCYHPACGPGDDCSVGQDCVDGTCCLPTFGAPCYFAPSGAFIPCCAPLGCALDPGGQTGSCACLVPGAPCPGFGCCIGSCDGGTCSCVPMGGACVSDTNCCSNSCVASQCS